MLKSAKFRIFDSQDYVFRQFPTKKHHYTSQQALNQWLILTGPLNRVKLPSRTELTPAQNRRGPVPVTPTFQRKKNHHTRQHTLLGSLPQCVVSCPCRFRGPVVSTQTHGPHHALSLSLLSVYSSTGPAATVAKGGGVVAGLRGRRGDHQVRTYSRG